jgi:tripartite-type tricarboxylate transporter receptor subunit TctC
MSLNVISPYYYRDAYVLPISLLPHQIKPGYKDDILKNLRDSYEGKCSRDSYIIRIDEISNYGIATIPVKNIKELVEYSKANPGKLSYASPGVGSTAHMLGEQLRLEGGLDWVHIPYGGSGSGKFIIDVIGGSTPAAVISIAVAASSVREGKVLGIGVPSSQINSALPLVPTFAQVGFERFNVASWFALLAPIGTPDHIIKRLNTDVAKVLATDAFKARMAIAGMDVTPSTPTELAQLIASDLKKWEKVAERIPKAQ